MIQLWDCASCQIRIAGTFPKYYRGALSASMRPLHICLCILIRLATSREHDAEAATEPVVVKTAISTLMFVGARTPANLGVAYAHAAVVDALAAGERPDLSPKLLQLQHALENALGYWMGHVVLGEGLQARGGPHDAQDAIGHYLRGASLASAAGDVGTAGVAEYNAALLLPRGDARRYALFLSAWDRLSGLFAVQPAGTAAVGTPYHRELAISAGVSAVQLLRQSAANSGEVAELLSRVGTLAPQHPRVLNEQATAAFGAGLTVRAAELIKEAVERAEPLGNAALLDLVRRNAAIIQSGGGGGGGGSGPKGQGALSAVAAFAAPVQAQLLRLTALGTAIRNGRASLSTAASDLALRDLAATIEDQTVFALLGEARGGAHWARLLRAEEHVVTVMGLCAVVLLREREVLAATVTSHAHGAAAGGVDSRPHPHPAAAVHRACAAAVPTWMPFVQAYFGGSDAPWSMQMNAAVTALRARHLPPPGRHREPPRPLRARDTSKQIASLQAQRRAATAAGRPRPLAAAVAGYDMRSHATGYLLEGLARHADRARVSLSVYQYGPVDPDTPLLPGGHASPCMPVLDQQGAPLQPERCHPRQLSQLALRANVSLARSGRGDTATQRQSTELSSAMLTGLGIGATQSERYIRESDAFYYVHPATPHAAVVGHMRGWCRPVDADGNPRAGSDSSSGNSSLALSGCRATPLDILIDPMANTFGHREPVVAAKPAPIVASHMVAATSGFGAVDWFIGDPVKTPPDTHVAPLTLGEPVRALLALAGLRLQEGTGESGRLWKLPLRHGANAKLAINNSSNALILPRILLEAFTEKLVLLPRSYSANYYTCALPLLEKPPFARPDAAAVTEAAKSLTDRAGASADGRQRNDGIGDGYMLRRVLSAVAGAFGRHNSGSLSHSPLPAADPCRSLSLLRAGLHTAGRSAATTTAPRPLVALGVAILDKLDPRLLTAWVGALSGHPHVKLWLLGAQSGANTSSGAAFGRLVAEAAARGLHPRRVVLLPRATRDEYMRRLAARPDIVLDTQVYSGHTTTLDAMWSGVPVVTIEGSQVAARVSSSHLQAAGTDVAAALITHSLPEFQRTAGALFTRPVALRSLRRRLLSASTRCAHLNWAQTVRNLERAYAGMWEVRAATVSGAAHTGAPGLCSGGAGWCGGDGRASMHIIVDPDLRDVTCATPGSGAGATAARAESGPDRAAHFAGSHAQVRFDRAVAERRRVDRQAGALLRTLGFPQAARVCDVRLSLGAGEGAHG